MQILLANVNTENDDNNKVIVENNVLTNRDNNSWMFDNNSSTSHLKHESVPSTTLLALHRLHPLLLHPLLLLMSNELHTYGITI